jgi:putative protein-disulfide isomerase
MELIYVHDPMCSWCWGYRPVLEKLRRRLPAGVRWRNLLGGLAPDSDEPMPQATRAMVMGHWRRIESQLGTKFNFDFWTRCQPRRSTYPACRAVLAAAAQDREEDMILAIQQAYYLHAMNPSDGSTLLKLANEIKLNEARFQADLDSEDTNQELMRQVSLARSWGIPGYPSLMLKANGGYCLLPLDYHDETVTIDALNSSRQEA